jgi:hypothetical protein
MTMENAHAFARRNVPQSQRRVTRAGHQSATTRVKARDKLGVIGMGNQISREFVVRNEEFVSSTSLMPGITEMSIIRHPANSPRHQTPLPRPTHL